MLIRTPRPFEQALVVVGSVLHAPVGMMRQPRRRIPSLERHFQRRDRQIVFEAAIQLPAEDSTGIRVQEYRRLVRTLLAQLNAGRRARLAEEIAVLRSLPERRTESYKRELVRVDSGRLIHVDRSAYSVPSRLIGARVEARLYMDQVEV